MFTPREHLSELQARYYEDKSCKEAVIKKLKEISLENQSDISLQKSIKELIDRIESDDSIEDVLNEIDDFVDSTSHQYKMVI